MSGAMELLHEVGDSLFGNVAGGGEVLRGGGAGAGGKIVGEQAELQRVGLVKAAPAFFELDGANAGDVRPRFIDFDLRQLYQYCVAERLVSDALRTELCAHAGGDR